MEVDVTLSNNPGITWGTIDIKFDNMAFKLVSVKDTNATLTCTYNGHSNFPITSGSYTLSWDDSLATTNNTTNGKLATLVFEVLAGATSGDKVIRVDNISFTDKVDASITGIGVDGKITLTSPTPSHTHSWSSEWSSDATYHWHKCTGTGTCDAGNVKDKAEHTWTAATCTTPKTCSICGKTEGNALGHNYTEMIEDEAHLKKAATKCTEYNEYWYDCSRCDANAKNDTAATDKYFTSTIKGSHHFTKKETTEAYYVADTGADCQHAKEYYYACADCNAVGTDKWTSTTKGPHSFDTTTWGYKGSDGHAHKCTVSGCTEHDTVVAHTPGAAATETTSQTCTVCHKVLTPALGHVHINHLASVAAQASTCTAPGNDAYWKCSCDKLFSDEAATTETTLAAVTKAALGHTPGDWQSDNDNHWKVCATCQAVLDKAAHSYAGDSNTCETCQHVREVTPPTDTVKVTFDANGGKFSDGSTTKEITNDTAVAIAACSENPTRENYRFDGWYTSAAGGTKLTPNDIYRQDTTVYAHWTYIGDDGSITIITHPDNDTTGTKENPGTGAVSSPVGYVVIGLAAVGALCFGAKKLIKKEEE